MLDAYVSILELDYFEITEALKGLADENVWKRPAPGLLSVGELVGHIVYWETLRFAGNGRDVADCKVQSPLIDDRFRYYTTSLEVSLGAEHFALGAEALSAEILRVHRETMAHLRELDPAMDGQLPGWTDNWTVGEALKYTIFHVAYHTGQIYSVRHLLGETPPDN